MAPSKPTVTRFPANRSGHTHMWGHFSRRKKAITLCLIPSALFGMSQAMANETNPLSDIKVDRVNLYREESFTDLKVATIRRLSPIKEDGTPDTSRPALFTGETTLMSERGPLPIQCPIEAKDLGEAMDRFPEAVQGAVEKLIEQAREMQRQSMSRIVVPGQGGPALGGMPGPGGFPGGGTPGGGKIVF